MCVQMEKPEWTFAPVEKTERVEIQDTLQAFMETLHSNGVFKNNNTIQQFQYKCPLKLFRMLTMNMY